MLDSGSSIGSYCTGVMSGLVMVAFGGEEEIPDKVTGVVVLGFKFGAVVDVAEEREIGIADETNK
jgi:hypothetical protein